MIKKYYKLGEALNETCDGEYIWRLETASSRCFYKGFFIHLIFELGNGENVLHEIIMEDRRIKLFMDIESSEMTKEDFDKEVAVIIGRVPGKYIVLDASRPSKNSVHVIFFEKFFDNRVALREYMLGLPSSPILDMAVYDKHHSLRMAYSAKVDCDIRLLPVGVAPGFQLDVFKKCSFHYFDTQNEVVRLHKGVHISTGCSNSLVETGLHKWADANNYVINSLTQESEVDFTAILTGVVCVVKGAVHRNNKCYLNVRISPAITKQYSASSWFFCPDITCRKRWPGPDLSLYIFGSLIVSSLQPFLSL